MFKKLSGFSLTLLFAFFIVPFFASADITTGLTAYYTFDDGTATDQSGSGKNGTVVGGVSFAQGKLGQAISLDGVSGYVNIGDVDLTSAFTVGAWINLNQLGVKQALIAKDYNPYQFFIDNTTNTVFFQRNSGNLSPGMYYTHNFGVGQWHHLVLTFDVASGYVLYLDGTSIKTSSDVTPINTNDAYTKIGATGSTPQYFLSGIVDDVRIYTRALSSSDVSELYNIVSPVATTNSASDITSSSAVLNATINPSNQSTSVYFQYGINSGVLSNQTASQTLSGNTDQPVTTSLTGLLSDTTYYYRAVAINNAGTIYGQEQSFTTQTAIDTTPPSIVISIPTTGQTYNSRSSKITIMGSSSDSGSGLNQIIYSSDTGSGSAVGTTNWTISDISLNQGDNLITVTAQDKNGNISTKSITVNYSPENSLVNFTGTSPWRILPLRTQAQKDAGLLGGEGMQMIQGIIYAPSNPNVVYLVVDTSQVWKSVDGGTTWYSKRNNFKSKGGTSIGVDPKNENIVFVSGTLSKADGTFTSVAVDGIYRTTDGGDNWQLVYQTDYYRGREGQHFAFDPDSFDGTKHQTIYAGTHSNGIVKSIDGGNTWTQLQTSTDLDRMRIIDLEIHKHNGQSILYVSANNSNNNGITTSSNNLYKVIDNNGTISSSALGDLPVNPRTISVYNQPDPNNDIIYAAVGTYKIYKSINGGATFVSASNGLVTYDSTKEFIQVSVSPTDPNYVYARVDRHGVHIFYSHDGGDNWHQATLDPEKLSLRSITNGYFATQVATHPFDKNIAIGHFELDALLKTVNGGQSWSYSGSGYTGARVGLNSTSYFFDKSNSKRTILFLTDFGPVITEDSGSTWRSLPVPMTNGAKTTPVGAVDPNNPNIIIAPVGSWYSQNVLRSIDGGQNWNTVNSTVGDYRFMAFHPQEPNYVYAGTNNGLSWLSVNNGQTWTSLPNKIIKAVYSGNGDIVYAVETPTSGNSILWRSNDKGINWINLGTAPFRTFSEVDINPENPDVIYVAAGTYGFYIFDGSTWRETGKSSVNIPADVFGAQTSRFFRNIVVDPNMSNVVYTSLFGPDLGHRQTFVFRSQDYGQTWEDIKFNLSGYSDAWSMGVDPRTSELYLDIDHGIYVLSSSSQSSGGSSSGGSQSSSSSSGNSSSESSSSSNSSSSNSSSSNSSSQSSNSSSTSSQQQVPPSYSSRIFDGGGGIIGSIIPLTAERWGIKIFSEGTVPENKKATENGSSKMFSEKQPETKTISSISLTKMLQFGSKNDEVKTLQQILSADKSVYPEGLITGYFGLFTKNAIIRFQKKYNLPQVGIAGPLTRKKILEVYGTSALGTGSASESQSSANQSSSDSASPTIKKSEAEIISIKQKLIELMMEVIKIKNNTN